MWNLCEKILAQLSGYDFVNSLLPGVTYVMLTEKITDLTILSDNMLENFVIYYSVGLVINRVGSLIIERMLRWRILTVSYDEYVAADTDDESGKLDRLSTVNNVYRTFVAMFACLILTIIGWLIWKRVGAPGWLKWPIMILGILLMGVLLAFSYRKQTTYIAGRVRAMNEKRKK